MACYFIQRSDCSVSPVKIGYAEDPTRRLFQLQTAHWEELALLRVFKGSFRDESALQRRFYHLHIHREWFHFTPHMLGDVGLPEILDIASLAHPGPISVEVVKLDIGLTAAEIIEGLGDTARVAAEFGLPLSAVSNWKLRGIPKSRLHDLVMLAQSAGNDLISADVIRAACTTKRRAA